MQASMTNWARICANKTASSSAISFATRSEFWNAGKIFRVCLDHITMTAKHCPVLYVLYSFARDSGEGKLKGKNMARCHTGDHRRQPSPWITFVSNHRAFNGLFLWSNTEFSTVWIEFPEQGKYIPLVFHGQELMNLWKVSNANKSHVFKGQDCSQLSHTSAFPSRWDQNQPTFKGGIRASWELLVRNFLPKHFQVKTAMQDCYQRTAAMERCSGFKN